MTHDRSRSFRCGLAARSLPWAAATTIALSALTAVTRLDGVASSVPGWGAFRVLLVLVAAGIALLIVRQGAGLAWVVTIESDGLRFSRGARRRTLAWDAIESVAWQPFGASRRSIVPGTLLVTDAGPGERLSALLDDGSQLVRELVRRSARDDLAAWSDALRLESRMGGARWRTVVGYAALVVWIVALARFVSG